MDNRQLTVIKPNRENMLKVITNGFENVFIRADVNIAPYGKVDVTIIFSNTMEEFEAKSILNGCWVNSTGKRFYSWYPLNEMTESISSDNFMKSEKEQYDFVLSVFRYFGSK